MESNKKYNDYVARREAIEAGKKKKETAGQEWEKQQTENSVPMAGMQTKNTLSGDNQSRYKDSESYHSRQKIIIPRPPQEEETEKPGGNYPKNYGAKTGSGKQLPTDLHHEDEKTRKKQLEEEARRVAINRAKVEAKQIAARVTRQAAQRTGQLAAQAGRIVVRATAQAVVSILTAAAGTIGWMGCLLIIIVVAALMIIIWIYKTCEANMISSAICTGLSWVGSALSWVWSWF